MRRSPTLPSPTFSPCLASRPSLHARRRHQPRNTWSRALTSPWSVMSSRCPQRSVEQINEPLQNDRLSPDSAARLAGRLTFLSRSTVRRSGGYHATLFQGGRHGRRLGRHIVCRLEGRAHVPSPSGGRGPTQDCAMGRACDWAFAPTPSSWTVNWGRRRATSPRRTFLRGAVAERRPVLRWQHLAPFAARKAFIYVLEIVAQHRQRRGAVRLHDLLRQGSLCQRDPRLILGLGS